LYLASSHAAVTIWNHHRKSITNVIKANIPNTRLMKTLTLVTNLSFCDVPAHEIHTHHADQASQKVLP
jgi:hypothetical protein